MSTPFSSELQRIASTGWGFGEREYLGEWELRASGGFTNRANAAWPLGDPGLPLPEALDAVRAWFGARGLAPRVAVVVGSELDERVAAVGFPGAEARAFRQVADIEPVLAKLAETADPDRSVVLGTELPEDFFTVYKRGQGQASAAAVLSSGGADLRFATIRDAAGALLAIGRLAIDHTSGYAGLSAIYTAEHVRRQGFSIVMLRDLLRSAQEAGCRRVYLEVDTGNVPALALYERIGFVIEHSYHYRSAA